MSSAPHGATSQAGECGQQRQDSPVLSVTRACSGRPARGLTHAASQSSVALSARMRFSICRRYAPARNLEGMRVLVVGDEPYMAEAIRDGLRLEAIAADIAGDGRTALELLSINAYDIAVLDRDIPGPSGDEIARRSIASGTASPSLMLTAPARLDHN